MHKSAMLRMEWFVKNYIPREKQVKVLDVGSADVNGSYRELFAGMNVTYTGLDMTEGSNVDYIPADPYNWRELADESYDFIISGNAFEHIEYPWLTICEIYKKLRKKGFVCILAPNSIGEHRYPLDCYRYFSDGFHALAKWAGFSVVNVTVGGVPSGSISPDWYCGGHNDTVMILTKEMSDEEIAGLPKFNEEKRYYPINEMGARCQFLIDWINIENKQKLMTAFFNQENIRKVYLYGYGKIGKIIYNELKNISNIVEINVIDKYLADTSDVKIIHTGEKIDEGKQACILNSLMSLEVLSELNLLYPNIKKYNVKDMLMQKI